MRPLLRLLPLLLAAALAGCGQAQTSANDFKGSEKAVASAIEDLQSAAQNRKPADICSDVLSRELADKLKSAGNDCVRELEKVTGDADDFELEVLAVTVTGTTATAEVRRGDDGPTQTMQFTQERGEWRATALS